MTQPDHSLLVKGYCMTLLGGLLWSVGGACGQVMFRSCGVTSNWLVPRSRQDLCANLFAGSGRPEVSQQ